jgi:hypothetical protein
MSGPDESKREPNGGVFIGLKDEMLERAEAYLEERKG